MNYEERRREEAIAAFVAAAKRMGLTDDEVRELSDLLLEAVKEYATPREALK